MQCAKFCWNWLSRSGEEDFLKSVWVFSEFRNYLPLEKGGALHLNKLESSSPKDALWQVWFSRRKKKLENFTTTTTTTDNGQTLIRKAKLSLRLRWANKLVLMVNCWYGSAATWPVESKEFYSTLSHLRKKLKTWVPQGSILRPLLFLRIPQRLFSWFWTILSFLA